jgi:uncharacterized coiled-coil protein SlyX
LLASEQKPATKANNKQSKPMSDRLDRIEANLSEISQGLVEITQGLAETRKIVDSNAKAILALAERSSELDAKIDRTNSIVAELASVVFAVTNRQQDHEDRINRLEEE